MPTPTNRRISPRRRIDHLVKMLVCSFDPIDKRMRYVDRIDTGKLKTIVHDICETKKLMASGGHP